MCKGCIRDRNGPYDGAAGRKVNEWAQRVGRLKMGVVKGQNP